MRQVRWSPYKPTYLAVAAAQYYGIVGNGRLYVLECDPMSQMITPVSFFESQDGQYDVAWSEMNDNQLVSTCGDGSVKLWDLGSPGFPLMSWQEHQAEVYSVDWNLITKDTFVTGSWDDTIKLVRRASSLQSPQRAAAAAAISFAAILVAASSSCGTGRRGYLCPCDICCAPRLTLDRVRTSRVGDRLLTSIGVSVEQWSPESQTSIRTLAEHQNCIYCVCWSPYQPTMFASWCEPLLPVQLAAALPTKRAARKRLRSSPSHRACSFAAVPQLSHPLLLPLALQFAQTRFSKALPPPSCALPAAVCFSSLLRGNLR